MIDLRQFRDEVIDPVLVYLGFEFASEAAIRLLLGTLVQESGARHLRQLGNGPAMGLYQVEPATHDDVWAHFLKFHPVLRAKTGGLATAHPDRHQQLAGNLNYATAIARLVYWRDSEPLPDADDIEGLARYYKRVFNTAQGKGSVGSFMLNYREHVEPILK